MSHVGLRSEELRQRHRLQDDARGSFNYRRIESSKSCVSCSCGLVVTGGSHVYTTCPFLPFSGGKRRILLREVDAHHVCDKYVGA